MTATKVPVRDLEGDSMTTLGTDQTQLWEPEPSGSAAVRSAKEIALEKVAMMNFADVQAPPAPPTYEALKAQAEKAEALEQEQLRLLAEFDNYRKRTVKEKETLFRESVGVTDLLAFADMFDRALVNAPEDGASAAFVSGIQLISTQLHALLTAKGIERIATVGEVFDPQRHDAVRTEANKDFQPNVVCGEFQPGYKLGDRVLRPAKVVVAGAPAHSPTDSAA